METTTRSGLHPLLTVAAISVTVLSAVGVGALTGLIPSSIGSSKPAEQIAEAAAAPQEAAKPAETPVAQPAEAPVAKPAHKPAHKPAVRKVAAAEPPAPIAYQTPSYEAPKPVVPAGILGTVESVKEISTPSDGRSGVGAIGGGIAGAVLGHQVGHGAGNAIATVLGAAGGALAGKEVEKHVNAKKSWEITVRMDDGTQQTIPSATEPFWHAGDRVRFLDGRLQPV